MEANVLSVNPYYNITFSRLQEKNQKNVEKFPFIFKKMKKILDKWNVS